MVDYRSGDSVYLDNNLVVCSDIVNRYALDSECDVKDLGEIAAFNGICGKCRFGFGVELPCFRLKLVRCSELEVGIDDNIIFRHGEVILACRSFLLDLVVL